MFAAIRRFFAKPPVEPRDVGRVTVTFYYVSRYVAGETTIVFDGEWRKAYEDDYVVDAMGTAKRFINGKDPVETKYGWIPRQDIRLYKLSDREPLILTAPNKSWYGDPL